MLKSACLAEVQYICTDRIRAMKISPEVLSVLATVCLLLQQPNPCVSQTLPGPPSPILIVPGLTASQLQVKDVGGCTTFDRFYGLWIDPYRFVDIECAQKELELVYDTTTNIYRNNDGVTIRVPGFGGTETVEFTNTDNLIRVPGFNDFVQYFVDRGYVRGETIRAAPYDWRLAADALEQQGYYDKLMRLVEEMYQDNGQQKVTIVVHSMGGPVSLHFLTGFENVTQEWKDTHINAWITLSGAWSGGNSALQFLISGPNSLPSIFMFARHFVDGLILPIVRTLESGVWMLPRASVWGNTTLVSTPTQNYTANDYQQLFSDVDFSTGYEMYERVLSINPDYPAPNVKTYCFYGVGVNTTQHLTFVNEFTGSSPVGESSKITFGNGDGTVNVQSSEICLGWKNMPNKYPFTSRTYEGVTHSGMHRNARVLGDIAAIVGAPEPTSLCGAVKLYAFTSLTLFLVSVAWIF